MTRSTLAIAGSKSQQFSIAKIDTMFNFYKPMIGMSLGGLALARDRAK